mmetsp:Transcript_19669/g.75532  ORF Transcript_19669/g.75532 Transcript_19669/m.75532 type:complete len:321 (+) Transcript_19669:1016-1978(+)
MPRATWFGAACRTSETESLRKASWRTDGSGRTVPSAPSRRGTTRARCRLRPQRNGCAVPSSTGSRRRAETQHRQRPLLQRGLAHTAGQAMGKPRHLGPRCLGTQRRETAAGTVRLLCPRELQPKPRACWTWGGAAPGSTSRATTTGPSPSAQWTMPRRWNQRERTTTALARPPCSGQRWKRCRRTTPTTSASQPATPTAPMVPLPSAPRFAATAWRTPLPETRCLGAVPVPLPLASLPQQRLQPFQPPRERQRRQARPCLTRILQRLCPLLLTPAQQPGLPAQPAPVAAPLGARSPAQRRSLRCRSRPTTTRQRRPPTSG